jgi:hypothetical protein
VRDGETRAIVIQTSKIDVNGSGAMNFQFGDEHEFPKFTIPKDPVEMRDFLVRFLGTDPRLATIVLNRYSATSAKHLADALDMMCAPTDAYGWSSSGIYVFWNPATKEVLYVGLALDLPFRFRQHNGLIACAANACKSEQITGYFKTNEYLGYSLLLQSPLDQPVCDRRTHLNPEELAWAVEEFGLETEDEAKRLINKHIDRTIRRAEGAMLAAHKREQGHLPAWNKIGGFDVDYSDAAISDGLAHLKAATGMPSRFDWLVARSTLSELAANPTWAAYESHLHGIRIAFKKGLPWELSTRIAPDPASYLKRMAEDNYMEKLPSL